jgi:hypothetical protein
MKYQTYNASVSRLSSEGDHQSAEKMYWYYELRILGSLNNSSGRQREVLPTV